MIGHEREVNEMREKIERLISERNSKQERINARRLKVRRGGRRVSKIRKGMDRGERATEKGEAGYETVSEESGERMVVRED